MPKEVQDAYVVVSVARVVTNAASFYVIARTALLMIHTLRSRLVGHLRTLSLRYFSNTSVGELIFRSINDARSIQEVMIFGFGTWITLAFRIVLMAVFMALLDPLLTVIALLVVPALAITIRVLARRGFAIDKECVERDCRSLHQFNESVCRSWVQVYRDPAKHWDLYELAEKLVDLEDAFRQWRFRHATTVERVIGFKRGTGGTSGVAYLRRLLDVVLFPELWRARTEL